MEEQARRLQIESTDKKSCIKALHDAYDRGLTDTISEMVSTHNKNVRKCEGGLIYDVNLLPDSQIMLYTDSGGLNWCFEKDLSVINELLSKYENPYTKTTLPASFIKHLKRYKKEFERGNGEKIDQFDDVMHELFGRKKGLSGLKKQTKKMNALNEILQRGLSNSGGDPYVSVSQFLDLDREYFIPDLQGKTKKQVMNFLYEHKDTMVSFEGNREHLIYFIVKAGLETELSADPDIDRDAREMTSQYARVYNDVTVNYFHSSVLPRIPRTTEATCSIQ